MVIVWSVRRLQPLPVSTRSPCISLANPRNEMKCYYTALPFPVIKIQFQVSVNTHRNLNIVGSLISNMHVMVLEIILHVWFFAKVKYFRYLRLRYDNYLHNCQYNHAYNKTKYCTSSPIKLQCLIASIAMCNC